MILLSLVEIAPLLRGGNGQTHTGEGVVDVHNDPPLDAVSIQGALNPWNGYLYNSTNVRDSSAFAQPFTPTLPLLTAIDIGLNVYYPEGAYCRVEIRESSTGLVLAYSEQQLLNGKSYEHFSLSASAKVSLGTEYLILLFGTQASREMVVLLAEITEKMWNGSYVLTRSPSGNLSLYEPPDFQPALAFRTYGLGGLPTTIQTTARENARSPLEAFVIALATVLVAASVVVVVLTKALRRKDQQT